MFFSWFVQFLFDDGDKLELPIENVCSNKLYINSVGGKSSA